MPAPVRVVLFGNSYAERVQLPALRAAGGNQVIGIAGHDPEKAARTAAEWNIGRSTGQWRELLDLRPDLVLISTPVDLHAPMVRAALAAGANVLCEKPFALDATEALELADLARQSGKLAVLDHQLRWNPYRRKLRTLLQQGYVGELQHVRFDLVLDNPGYFERPFSWWFQAERGGGVLGALGSHLIDGVLWMLGPVESVRARLRTYVKSRADSNGVERRVSADDHAELWLQLASGVDVSLTTAVSAPGASRFLIEACGSLGTLRLDLEDDLIGGLHGQPMEPIAVEGGTPTSDERGPFAALEPLLLAEVLDAVRAGKAELEGAASFDDGVECMRIIDAARRSAKGGSRVRL